MTVDLDTLLNQFSQKIKEDVGLPFLWMRQNLAFVEKNINVLQTKSKNPVAYALLINFLLIKNDSLQASHHIYLFQKEHPKDVLSQMLLALHYLKTEQLKLAYNALNQILNVQNSYYVWELLLDCTLKLKWHDAGVALSQKAQKSGAWKEEIMLNFLDYEAYFHHHNFNFDKSIALRNEQFRRFINLKSFTSAQTEEQKFNTSSAWQSLIDILYLLKINNIIAFPVAGTLLGLHREGKLLDFDKDLDIGVMPDEDLAAIKQILEKNPRYELSVNVPAFTSYVSFIDKNNGCTIDILKFRKNRGYFELSWMPPKPYQQMSRILRYTPFTLSAKTFNNVTMYVPDDTDLFLQEIYGEWKTPDPHYFSILSQNLVAYTKLAQSATYFHLFRYLNLGNYKKALIIIKRAEELGDTNDIFSSLKKRAENLC